jgi:hypothetical protein
MSRQSAISILASAVLDPLGDKHLYNIHQDIVSDELKVRGITGYVFLGSELIDDVIMEMYLDKYDVRARPEYSRNHFVSATIWQVSKSDYDGPKVLVRAYEIAKSLGFIQDRR